MAYEGLDTSQFQRFTSFPAVKAAGKNFIIPRAGYGSNTIDSGFFNTVKGALTAGIRIPGVYWFNYFLSTAAARTEAQAAVNAVKAAGLPTSTIIFSDSEYDTARYCKQNGVAFTKSFNTACVVAFCEEVERLGYQAGVYYNQDFHNNYLNMGQISKYHSWLAWYHPTPIYSCEFHQYTSSGSCAGIISRGLDMDRQYSDQQATAAPTARNYLQKGDTGDDVKTLQTMLTKCGYECGGVDGIFGSKTEAAVREWQKWHQCTVDGLYGPQTKGTLEAAYAAATSAPTYTVGKNYKVLIDDVYVRTGAGTQYSLVGHGGLTQDGKMHDRDNDGALDNGTTVTCQAVQTVGKDIWIKAPSGWMAAWYNGQKFIG